MTGDYVNQRDNANRKPDFRIYSEMREYLSTRHIGHEPITAPEDLFARIAAEGRGEIRTVQLPFRQLNKSVGNGLAFRNITAIVAPPGASKSWLNVNFILHAQKQGFAWKYLPLEDTAEKWVERFMAAKLCDWRIAANPGEENPDDRIRLAEHKRLAMESNRAFLEDLYSRVAENPRIVPDPATGEIRAEVHYESVLTFIEDEAKFSDIIVIDPVTQIDFSEDGRSDYAGQARFMQRLVCGNK